MVTVVDSKFAVLFEANIIFFGLKLASLLSKLIIRDIGPSQEFYYAFLESGEFFRFILDFVRGNLLSMRIKLSLTNICGHCKLQLSRSLSSFDTCFDTD